MRGDGRVYRRGTRYWIAYYDKRQHKEVREPAGDTEKKAEKKLRDRLAEIRTGAFIGPQEERLTVGDLLTTLETHLENKQVKSTSHVSHIKVVRQYFGLDRAVSLGVERLERFRAEQRAAGKKPATVNREVGVLRQAYRLAVKQQRLSPRSVPYFPMDTERNARRGFFEAHEFAAVLPYLKQPIADAARFAYATGWRRGEVCGLTWDCIDRLGREVRLTDSKNGEGRVLALEGEAWELIEERWTARTYLNTAKQPCLARFVFHDRGRRLGDFRKAWAKAFEKAELPARLFHDLRRTAVRDMVRAGVPQSVAMSVSGHKTVSVFLRYKITSGDEQREALRRTAELRQTERKRAAQVVRLEKRA